LTHEPHRNGHVEQDERELVGIKDSLGIRSSIIVFFQASGVGDGAILASSAKNEYFSEGDLRFLEATAHWVGLVAHRAEGVRRATREAAEQARTREAEDLMAVVAHDLRNLLAPLSIRLQLLRRRAPTADRAVLVEHATQAEKALERLRRFVDELLDVERLERGIFTLRLDEVDLPALAREVAHTFSGQGVDLRVDISDTAAERGATRIVGDANRLRQALENVTGNAVRHSPEGETVTLSLDVEERSNGRDARLTVSDRGPGLPPELLPNLFTKFGSGPGSSGLGLGLYLAKRIAVAHGGDLTADPSPRIGARFSFVLPAEPVQ
jgi:two-component system, OmpR family, sensor kinase